MYTCIVAGFDGSDAAKKAVEKAAMLAEKLGAKLVIVTVVPTPSILLGEFLLPEPVPSQQVLEAVREGLDKLAEDIRGRYNVEIETMVVEGDPAESLLDVAKGKGCSAIVVGRRGRGLAVKLLGSVTSKLVNIAKGIDVIVVEPEK
ncbi:UspA domain-containing protein [Pyrolobus fumarii 1A]|uniref:UspA domain-containing protein n=1 Tax=Pyrolobus fumarii (strain DSM 11204 / 1A) TaxID=694429 RepID=G0EFW8_PYRF1|nr:universal stress protein [Pyrolobus fumarii]AEM39069.1 UspA domain-containing protein [Pyrolobus fumarii 1A]